MVFDKGLLALPFSSVSTLMDSSRNSGCLGLDVGWTDSSWVCLGYADDLLILSASRSGLQSMVMICEEFAKSKSLKFSTHVDPKKSKTKCIMFSKSKPTDVAPILLNGDPLPWVREVNHLGTILQSDNSMKMDCVMKRGKFIGKLNSLLKEFHFVDSSVFVILLNLYASSFYGSNLWDLYSVDVERIYKSWNVTMRNGFNLPWTTQVLD